MQPATANVAPVMPYLDSPCMAPTSVSAMPTLLNPAALLLEGHCLPGTPGICMQPSWVLHVCLVPTAPKHDLPKQWLLVVQYMIVYQLVKSVAEAFAICVSGTFISQSQVPCSRGLATE